ncbi:MAG: ABC transporter permease [Bdellovibrionales bacterium]|nr:ABC transporter permease [Bdellovibrionales bacterium]
MLRIWLVIRYFWGNHKLVNLTSFLAIFGMILAVASLVVSMAVVSGFFSTLKTSVINVTSHIVMSRSGGLIRNRTEVEEKVKKIVGKNFVAMSPYVALEAVMGHKKKLAGVLVEGIEDASVDQVLNIRKHLLEGAFDFEKNEDDVPGAVVGKSLAEKFNIQIGDVFRVVIPRSSQYDREAIRPKLQKFQLRGIIDLGRQDFNDRYIVSSQKAVQEFGGFGDGISGYWMRIKEANDSGAIVYQLISGLGSTYWIRDWRDVNRNLFEAVELEKTVIFFVLLVLVLAASVNVISTLFVNVLRRYRDIAILKAMGATRGFVVSVFMGIGAIIGAIGIIGGFAVGGAACYGFEWLQDSFHLLRPEVYKLDRIEVYLNWQDIVAISGVTLLICLVATLAPAIKGAYLSPVEGLKYE